MYQNKAKSKHSGVLGTVSPRVLRKRIAASPFDAPKAALCFLGSFLRNPAAVGAFWPSSGALARMIANCCDFSCCTTVVELGSGTGALTMPLIERMRDDCRFMAIEINPANVAVLRRRVPGCEVIHDSAENLPRYLDGRSADCIVSGLAWGNMSPRIQDSLIGVIRRSLAPGGQFVAFAYHHARWLPKSKRFHRSLKKCFGNVVTSPVVWRNLPPAYVYRCSLAQAPVPAQRTCRS